MGNIRILARRILGRKGTAILRNAVSEVFFRLSLIPPANSLQRPEGITAMVCTYNEEDWIIPSLLSIKDLVDEYIVVDSSTDQTPLIVKKLQDEYGLNIKLIRIPEGDLVTARNLVLKESKYKWILHWDADFIAREELKPTIERLLSDLDERKYYLVYWPHICLDGDLFHQSPNMPLHIEHWLFTWCPRIRYAWVDHYDSLIAPLRYYKVVYLNKPLSFHLRTVRNPVRLLYKHYWWQMRAQGLERKVSLDEYVRKKIKEDYGTDNIEEAANLYLKEYLTSLTRYDKEKYGDYPLILKKYVKEKLGINL